MPRVLLSWASKPCFLLMVVCYSGLRRSILHKLLTICRGKYDLVWVGMGRMETRMLSSDWDVFSCVSVSRWQNNKILCTAILPSVSVQRWPQWHSAGQQAKWLCCCHHISYPLNSSGLLLEAAEYGTMVEKSWLL